MVALLLLIGCGEDATRCGAEADCYEVEGGRYYARMPDDPSGDALPAMVYFHGYSSSGRAVFASSLADEMRAAGLLVIAPDGVDHTWAHVGSPSHARDELSYVDAVMADAESRWPLGPRWVSGFSQGGSMAWDVACYRPEAFDAFLPISGAFWEPLPANCDGPVHMRHTHGTADTTVPMEGRPIGVSSEQGDVMQGVAVWRTTDGCAEAPDRTVTEGATTCQVWETCDSGRVLWLCLHDGAHQRPSGWLDDALPWAEALPPG